MRQASGDLFPTDSPIPASQMIGRRDDVREIATRLEAGTHLIVAGPRRTGKTSVCEAALMRARRRGVYVAKIDLFRVSEAAELAEAVAAAVIANRSAAHRLLRRVRGAGRAALSAAQARAVVRLVGELGEGVEVALTPGLAAEDPERALGLALELPERVAKADGRRLILFFDEFQEVASARRPYGDPDAVTKRMRAIFQRSTAVSYLFAGSIEHVMRDLFAPSRRAFSGFGSFYALRPIVEEEWLAGLRERFAEDDCAAADAALERIVELGGGHPRATMRIAQQTHLVSLELDTRDIGLDIVQVGYDRALEGDRPTMEQVVERIRLLHKHGLLVARAVASDLPPPRRLHPGVRDRVLKLLRDAGIVEHEARGRWRVTDPLLRRYLASLDPFA
ncbi:MAG: uncharacterized protein QOK00_1084 [Thermoleophilaceae bacterium]|jgi:hypothetical protein|nr:uncharacterized protein [Thermoleophilaceae bacterium]MEA2400681.1 uncharacterized protein [Thermoleophilaceae bacterium]